MADDLQPSLQQRLEALVRASPWFMEALHAADQLGLESWCIGAGAVRNLVWDALHGQAPSTLSDIDVVYFDAACLDAGQDTALQRRLEMALPGAPWEVSNQAAVHLWFEAYFGHAVAPLASLQEAVASWPEYATAVGVFLDATGTIGIIAPHGLDDLFGIVVRRNPARVSVATYRERIAQKQYARRWPQVRIVDC